MVHIAADWSEVMLFPRVFAEWGGLCVVGMSYWGGTLPAVLIINLSGRWYVNLHVCCVFTKTFFACLKAEERDER